jgi:hypothetical protein
MRLRCIHQAAIGYEVSSVAAIGYEVSSVECLVEVPEAIEIGHRMPMVKAYINHGDQSFAAN